MRRESIKVHLFLHVCVWWKVKLNYFNPKQLLRVTQCSFTKLSYNYSKSICCAFHCNTLHLLWKRYIWNNHLSLLLSSSSLFVSKICCRLQWPANSIKIRVLSRTSDTWKISTRWGWRIPRRFFSPMYRDWW